MTFATNLADAFTRIATEDKLLHTLINGNAADNTALVTTAKNNLVAAINELSADIDSVAAGSGATSLDALSDVAVSGSAVGHILRHNGTNYVNVLGTDFFVSPAALSTAIANLVNAAPGTLDTLGEIAAALASDESGAAALATTVAGKQAGDPTLTALAGVTVAADQVIYATGPDAFTVSGFTAAGRLIAGAADAAAQRTAMSVWSKAEIGDITTDFVATFEAGLV